MPVTDFEGIDGFLGTRSSLMMDLLVTIMFAVVVVLAWSVYQVKYRRRFALHKRVQVPLTIVLWVVVIIFEIDTRISGWQDRASGVIGGDVSTSVWVALVVHIVIAVCTMLLLPIVVIRALRGFGSPPKPGDHSRSHVIWGRAAAVGLVLTAVSSWLFYVLAFV